MIYLGNNPVAYHELKERQLVRPRSTYAKCNALIKETGEDVTGGDVTPPTRPQLHGPTTRSPLRARLCSRFPHTHSLNSDTPARVTGPFGPARGLRGGGGRVWPARAARGGKRLLTSGWPRPLYGSEWGPAFPTGLDTGGVCESNKATRKATRPTFLSASA